MTTKLLKAREVAQILGVHRNRVFAYARERDDFPKAIRFSSRTVRWDADAIQAFIDSKKGRAA